MASIIKIKRSITPGSAPSTLQAGELAVNLADKKLYVGDITSTPQPIGGDQYNLVTVANTSHSVTGVDVILTVDNSNYTNDAVSFVGSDGKIALDRAGNGAIIISTPTDIVVDGQLTVGENVVATGNGSFGGTLSVTGATTLTDNLDVNGATTLANVTIDASSTIDMGANKVTNIADPTANQDAASKAYVDTAVSSASSFDISGDTGTDEVVTGTDTLAFVGTANEIVTAVTDNQVQIGLTDDVTIAGQLTVGENVVATGNGSFGGTLGVTGEATLASATVSDLTSGRVVLAGTGGAIEDSGNLTFDGSTLAVTGAATVSSTLDVAGLSSLDGGIDVNGSNFTVNTDGDTYVAGQLTVGENIVTVGNVEVGGTFTVTGTTEYSGDVSISGDLDVTGTTNLNALTATSIQANGTVTIDDTTDSSSISTGALVVDGGVGIAKKLFVGDDARFEADLIVDGNLTVEGAVTYISSSTVNVDDSMLKLSANNSADSVDTGVYGKYIDGATTRYAGYFRDSSDSDVFKFYANTTVEPTTTVDTSGTGYHLAQIDAIIDGGTY